MIKITQPYEQLQVNNIIMYIYALPSMWKSSLAMTAKNAILINFDKGAHRVDSILRRCPVMHIDDWNDIGTIKQKDLEVYDTIILDTVGTMQECIRMSLASERKNVQGNGVLKLQVQQVANSNFNRFIQNLIYWKKDIVFLGHAIEDKNNQDMAIIRPDLGGRSRQELYRLSDCMALLSFEQKGNALQRVLHFAANQEHLAKDCADLRTVEIPNLYQNATFLGDLIQHVKKRLNSMTPEQTAHMKQLQDAALWRDQCNEAKTVKDFNALLPELAAAKEAENPQYKPMWDVLKTSAKNLGFIFDNEQKQWLESA